MEVQDGFADAARAGREQVRQGTSDEQAHQFGLGRLRWTLAHNLPVAHDRDTVGDAGHLLQPVRDVDHADATGLKVPHDPHEVVGLDGREGGRWLVHDEDAGVGGKCLGDRDELPLSDPEA